MKKTLTIIAAFLAMVTSAKAENVFTGLQTNESAEVNICDAATDQALLESKKPLLAKPDKDAKKNAAYWAQAVGSRVKVMAYAQGGYTAEFQHSGAVTNTFDMKRVILMVGVDIAKNFYAFFMHDFKSGTMQEYYLEYRPFKAFNVRFGQSKKEFSMENPMSPTVLESIGPMSQGVFWLCGKDPLINNPCGRDIGLTFYGDFCKDKLRYVAQVVNGGQVNQLDKNNEKDIILKLEYKPIPNLRFSVSGQKGWGYSQITKEKPSPYNKSIEAGETYHSDRWAVGAEWKSKKQGSDYYKNRCASIRAEVLGGIDGKVNSVGGYISTAVPVYKQLDVVGMVDCFSRDTEHELVQTNLMAGVQYWIHKKCRLQAQYTFSALSEGMKRIEGKDNYHAIQAQVQVAF